MNDLRHYQQQSKQTITPTVAALPRSGYLSYFALGLASEAGEVAGKIKKHLRGDKDVPTLREELVGELGDVLWYVAMTAEALDLDLGEVAASNINKLHDRKARGTLQGDGDNR